MKETVENEKENEKLNNESDLFKNGGIDIVVPVFRVEKFLERCVDSILGQTFRNFRLILVDDGSDDRCPLMCDEYAQKDERIHVIHKKNGGLSDARNAGIDWAMKESANRWICYIDSDDYVLPQFLEFMHKAVTENHVDLCRCSLRSFSDDQETDDCSPVYDVQVMNAEDAYIIDGSSSNVCAQGKLYRKSLFRNVRYPVGKLHEDLFTTYKLVMQCSQVAVLQCALYMYFINVEGITHSRWNKRRLDELEAFDQQLAFFKDNRKMYVKLLKKYLLAVGDQYNQLQKIKEESAEYKEYSDYLKKRMRNLITKNLRYHFEVFPECRWCYSIAFPNSMRLYWKYKEMRHSE